MLKKLKSLFIVEEEGAEDQKAEQKATPYVQDATRKPTTNTSKQSEAKLNSVVTTATNKNVKPDSKFLNSLLSAVEANNLDGFDYLEYKQSLQSLSKMQMDEATKFKSAFAMAKTMGASTSKLVQSGQHYLKVLAKEQAKFMEAYQGQLARAKGTDNINNLEKSISQKEKQIEQLTKEIGEEKRLLDKQKNQVNKSIAKVQLTKDSFMNAYAIVAGQIQEDIKKMNNYLK